MRSLARIVYYHTAKARSLAPHHGTALAQRTGAKLAPFGLRVRVLSESVMSRSQAATQASP